MLCQLTDRLETNGTSSKIRFDLSLSTLDNYFSSIPMENASESIKALLQPIADFQQILWRTDKQVTFFGAFKVGKSTLLNAIIGSKLLPSRANRATGVITKISYAPQPSASVLRRTTDNHVFEESIHFDDIAKYILLDLSDTTSKSPDGIEEVSIHIPCSILEHCCTLADTPGLLDNQTLTERTFQELEKSDLAVMVLSADKLLSDTEKDAAIRVHELLNGNIVFVVNRLGLVDEEDREEVLDWARTALQGLGNPLVGQPHVFATESRGALDAKKNGTKQGEAVDGLLEFEQWLEELTNTPVGEKIVLLSRLGILEGHLKKARGYFQSQLTEAQARMKDLSDAAGKTLAEQQAELRKAIAEDRRQLIKVKSKLDDLDEDFVDECIENVEDLMESDQELSEKKLKKCFKSAIKSYTKSVHRKVNSAILQTNLSISSFDLGESHTNTEISVAEDSSAAAGFWVGAILGGVLTGGLGAAIGGGLGALIGGLFGKDVKQETLNSVEKAARDLLPSLRATAEQHIDEVDQALSNLGKLNQPKIQISPDLEAAQQTEQYYSSLVSWCDKFQNAINNIKKEITG